MDDVLKIAIMTASVGAVATMIVSAIWSAAADWLSVRRSKMSRIRIQVGEQTFEFRLPSIRDEDEAQLDQVLKSIEMAKRLRR